MATTPLASLRRGADALLLQRGPMMYKAREQLSSPSDAVDDPRKTTGSSFEI